MKKRVTIFFLIVWAIFSAEIVWGFTEGGSNNFFGLNAGYTNTSGYYNSFFGAQVGYLNTTGHENSFLGSNAGFSNTTGSANCYFGNAAGYTNSEGSQNNFFGSGAGHNNTSFANNFFGFQAGYYNTGYQNIFIGNLTGQNNLTGNNNVFLGSQAGMYNNGSYNVFLGYQAGEDETGSNKLYIANTDTSSPLIYGDFNTQYLEFNGQVTVNDSVGIGTSNPQTELEVAHDGIMHITATSYYEYGGPGGAFNGRRARGNMSSPSAVLADDILARFGGFGYGETDWPTQPGAKTRAGMTIYAAEDWTDYDQGAFISFKTTPIGGGALPDRNIERMRITDSGKVGIGTDSPSALLEVVAQNPIHNRIIATTYHTQISGDHAGGGVFTGRLIRGNLDNPSPVLVGDTLAGVTGQGYSGFGGDFSGPSPGAMFIRADEDWTDTANGTRIVFVTTPAGDTSPSEKMRISSEGNVGIGIPNPQSSLQVAGYAQLDVTGGFLPPPEDCNEATEYGRMMVDEINEYLYICVASGWTSVKGKK